MRLTTAGESHGPALVGILEGMPAGLTLSRDAIARDLQRRRDVAGRSARQRIEDDVVEVMGGVRRGVTIGAPIALVIHNRDHARWRSSMAPWPDDNEAAAPVTVPRPGHADLAGVQKLGTDDVRDVLERASARETAMRTALGSLCKQLLAACDINIASCVVQIGDAHAGPLPDADADVLQGLADASPVRAVDAAGAARMLAVIDAAKKTGDTVGGAFVVVVDGVPAGLGSHAQWDKRLTTRLAAALASIPAVRAVGVGVGDDVAHLSGRALHDAIVRTADRLSRASNRAGGIEGGISNGMPIILRASVKPLATVAGGLPTVDLATGEVARGLVERSDTCAVPAAAVVGEAMVALALCDALLEKTGGDGLVEVQAALARLRT